MSSTDFVFASRLAHRSWLNAQAVLPAGFRCGTASFPFVPVEVDKPAQMTLTLIAPDQPTSAFALMFTRNAFPGAPVLIGRKRQQGARLGAVLINNKVSNVCAPGGVATAEKLCAGVGAALNIAADEVLPCSTGVIGWKLPEAEMLRHLPSTVAALQSTSVLPAAEGICTTDLFPKVRRAVVGNGGSIVGIAKGAGMIEPNLATMLVYLLTDVDVPRETLREALTSAVAASFNKMSIDSDTSTSDTVALLSSSRRPCRSLSAFIAALTRVCSDLAEDIVRNGEGVHHVIRVTIRRAPNEGLATLIGKAVVNSPLFQCAVCGNDPNVGRLVAAIGKAVGALPAEAVRGLDLTRLSLTMGGRTIFSRGAFRLDRATETALITHLRSAELYASRPPADGLSFTAPIDYPPHERAVEIDIDLGSGTATSLVIGGDRSHEYISENADYRS